ncbi:TetR/AcrR family transcriptional regulator C-terminal domain-containing protein [Pseudonocardia humida]|uniref:TetR/AcrR family transcriptional regulator n=1 Tax=Pseudonocardia humida TaxID=2800819 RepID=A0ABT0ZW10_9PSEU|nr:TetR/AcrR family transcriptional regulator C-terminal domain-containing protein [Pseudonocardia humida]MCO1654913.1 TetR/AcrR family transcriptional regulator [Pseudonocardia humida]
MPTRPAAGPRSPLNRDRVLRAAADLADRDGLAALTMRKLGQELGVEAMSLYKHVANKDEVLDGLAELVLGEFDLPTDDVGWRQAMRRRAVSARAALARHPWGTVVLSRTRPGPAMLRNLDSVIGSLRRAGFSVELAAHAFSLLDSYVYGYAVQEASLPFDTPAELTELTASIMDGFSAAAYPHLAEMGAELIMKPGYDHGEQFGYGLELVLDGLERARDAAA